MKRLSMIAVLLVAFSSRAGEKQDKPPLQPLWPDAAPLAKGKEAVDVPGIMVYPAPKEKSTGVTVVICPGGGYGHLAMDHEGHQVAVWLNSLGATGIVLKYRLTPYRHPAPLLDAQRAIRTTRAHAKEWGVDPAKVGILGFSAGGHLASTVGTHFDSGLSDAQDPIDRQSSRPDFMILGYPVIRLDGPIAHVGSRKNLLGENADPKLVQFLSNDSQVTPQTPPTFLVHTSEDKSVPADNSVVFYQALVKNKVPAELHIFEKGRHGLGLGPAELPFSGWPERCAAWMRSRELIK